MPDLELRVTGSRLLSSNKNPYFYIWQLGDDIQFYNPNLKLHSYANGVTSTPVTLWLQKGLASLPYCSIKKIWWCIEELCLFISFWFCWKLPNNRFSQIVIIVVTTAFFMFSYNWWLHIYNGQMYVLYTLAFSAAAFVYTKQKSKIFFAVSYPFIALLRPFFAFAILPFIQLRKRWIVTIAMVSAVCIFLTITTTSTTLWQQYFAAMKIYANEAVKSSDWHVERINQHYFTNPVTAEDCTINHGNINFPFSGGCLYSIQHYLTKFGIFISSSNVFIIAMICVMIVLHILAVQKKIFSSLIHTLTFSFLLYLLCELFTPASRNPYGMIQWLPFVCLILMEKSYGISLILIAGLFLNHNLPNILYGREAGELMMLTALLFFTFIPKQEKRNLQQTTITN